MQILQAGPTEESLRSQAFKQDMNRGLQAAAQAQQAMQQQEALTLRQKAMQEQQRMQDLAFAQKLKSETGVNVSPDQINQFRELGTMVDMTGQESPLARALNLQAQNQFQGAQTRKRIDAEKRRQDQELQKLVLEEKKQAAAERSKPYDQTREAQKYSYEQGLKNQSASQDRLVPGVGTALTVQDAKDLKDAKIQKAKFDRQLGELINLRKDKGVEYLDREAVARGKQLSKDLLLTYKNLAKLGVLSQSDEAIINAIIPGDPLGQDFDPFGDPILSNLEKFKGDLEADYQERLGAKLDTRGGVPQSMAKAPAAYDPQRGFVLSKPIEQMTPQERQELRQQAINAKIQLEGTAQR